MPGDDSKWRAIRRRVRSIGRRSAAVGVFEGRHSSGIALAELAAVHELGTSQVPARSFIRAALREKRAELENLLERLSARVLTGAITEHTAMSILGRFAVSLIRERVRTVKIPPPIAPETVRRKGHDHPLIDTGQLVDAVSSRVVSR